MKPDRMARRAVNSSKKLERSPQRSRVRAFLICRLWLAKRICPSPSCWMRKPQLHKNHRCAGRRNNCATHWRREVWLHNFTSTWIKLHLRRNMFWRLAVLPIGRGRFARAEEFLCQMLLKVLRWLAEKLEHGPCC